MAFDVLPADVFFSHYARVNQMVLLVLLHWPMPSQWVIEQLMSCRHVSLHEVVIVVSMMSGSCDCPFSCCFTICLTSVL